jgi:hypothetical protein
MLKKILIAVAVIIVVFLVIVALQPAEFPRHAIGERRRRPRRRCLTR